MNCLAEPKPKESANADTGRMRWMDYLPRGEREPGTVRLSLAEADAYLASFGDPTGTAARRADLIAELCERLPRTTLANEVIEAIGSRTSGG